MRSQRRSAHQAEHSQESQSENRRRSRRSSASARKRSRDPAGGSSGVASGNASSSAPMIAALSVIRRPSSSSAGSSPEGTFAVYAGGLSPARVLTTPHERRALCHQALVQLRRRQQPRGHLRGVRGGLSPARVVDYILTLKACNPRTPSRCKRAACRLRAWQGLVSLGLESLEPGSEVTLRARYGYLEGPPVTQAGTLGITPRRVGGNTQKILPSTKPSHSPRSHSLVLSFLRQCHMCPSAHMHRGKVARDEGPEGAAGAHRSSAC